MKNVLCIIVAAVALSLFTERSQAQWSFNGLRIYYVNGNVGIGIINPSYSLEVQSAGLRAISASANLATGTTFGVYGVSQSTAGRGVFGFANAATGSTFGVLGQSNSATGRGVYGLANSVTGVNYGVFGQTNSPTGFAGYFTGGKNYFSGNVGIGTTSPTFQLQLGTNSAAKPTSGAWTISSDARLKKNVQTIDGALEQLMSLRGVRYQWKDPSTQGGMDGTYTGMIAQEVERVFPEWVSVDANGYKTLTVIGFEGLVVEALRSLRREKDAQIALQRQQIEAIRAEKDAQISLQQKEIDILNDRLDRIENALAKSQNVKEQQP